MNTEHPRFDSVEEFIALFSLENSTLYSEAIPLRDRRVAFSTQRLYPNNCPFIPAKLKNGEPDTVVLIHVVYPHRHESNEKYDSHKVPITIRLGPFSKWRADHFDYDFFQDLCPTEESVRASKASPQPREMLFMHDFFYDHHANSFYGRMADVKLSGEDLLNRVFEAHINSIGTADNSEAPSDSNKTKTPIIIRFCNAYISGSKWLLRHWFDRTIDDQSRTASFLQGYSRSDLKRLSTDSLIVFGYKCSPKIVFFLCALTAIASAVAYWAPMELIYVKRVFSNTYLSTTHSILMLALLDVALPEIIFWSLNQAINFRFKCLVQ